MWDNYSKPRRRESKAEADPIPPVQPGQKSAFFGPNTELHPQSSFFEILFGVSQEPSPESGVPVQSGSWFSTTKNAPLHAPEEALSPKYQKSTVIYDRPTVYSGPFSSSKPAIYEPEPAHKPPPRSPHGPEPEWGDAVTGRVPFRSPLDGDRNTPSPTPSYPNKASGYGLWGDTTPNPEPGRVDRGPVDGNRNTPSPSPFSPNRSPGPGLWGDSPNPEWGTPFRSPLDGNRYTPSPSPAYPGPGYGPVGRPSGGPVAHRDSGSPFTITRLQDLENPLCRATHSHIKLGISICLSCSKADFPLCSLHGLYTTIENEILQCEHCPNSNSQSRCPHCASNDMECQWLMRVPVASFLSFTKLYAGVLTDENLGFITCPQCHLTDFPRCPKHGLVFSELKGGELCCPSCENSTAASPWAGGCKECKFETTKLSCKVNSKHIHFLKDKTRHLVDYSSGIGSKKAGPF